MKGQDQAIFWRRLSLENKVTDQFREQQVRWKVSQLEEPYQMAILVDTEKRRKIQQSNQMGNI